MLFNLNEHIINQPQVEQLSSAIEKL